MRLNTWLPDIEWPWCSSPDEDFKEVYEAYEDFYKAANLPNGRKGNRVSASQDFIEALVEYYDIGGEEANASWGMSLFLNADGRLEQGPLEEKYTEEELYHYLSGNL